MHLIALEKQPTSRRGGQEFNMLEICRGLHKRGHKVTLFYVNEGDLIDYYREFCSNIIKVNRYGFDRRKIYQFFDFLPGVSTGLKLPVSRDSVLFCNQYHDLFYGYALSTIKKIPFVCYLQLPPPETPINLQIRLSLKQTKKFIAVSNKTKLDWVKSGYQAEKIDVVHNGANLDKFQPCESFSQIRKEWNFPEDLKIISYVGRLDKDKGLETLIKAFALLLKSDRNTKLLIAGKPLLHFTPDGVESPLEGEKYKQSLHQLVKDLGIEEFVSFLGHVSNPASVYQVSDVVVLPSIWSEPGARVVFESMACATPMVASRVGGNPEVLSGEFQNQLFEPGDEQSLADTLIKNMYWRDNNPQLGQRCRQHILNNFTLERLVDGIEKSLLKVVAA
ncbi:MAG: glycosyltransferase family 4 protein [Phormidium sp.]